MNKAYLFAGYPASGKTTALKTAYEEGLHTIEMSNVVRKKYSNETENEHREVDDNTIGQWATEQRLENSFGYFAEYAAKLARNRVDSDSNLAVSGIRSIEEVDTFKFALPETEVVTIGIRCPEPIRWKWGFEERNNRPSEMKARDQRENEWGLDKLLNRHTDMIIRNGNVTEERFKQKIRDVVTE